MTYLTAPNKYVLYLETLFSVRFAYSNHIFNTPTKYKYTIKYMFYYQYSPTCFGVYCAIFREDLCRMLKTMLQYLITNLKIQYIWVIIL